MAEYYSMAWMGHICLSICLRTLGCFHLWAIVNTAVVSIYIQVSIWVPVLNSFEPIPWKHDISSWWWWRPSHVNKIQAVHLSICRPISYHYKGPLVVKYFGEPFEFVSIWLFLTFQKWQFQMGQPHLAWMNEQKLLSSRSLCLLICKLGAVITEQGKRYGGQPPRPAVAAPLCGRGSRDTHVRPCGWRYEHDEWMDRGIGPRRRQRGWDWHYLAEEWPPDTLQINACLW